MLSYLFKTALWSPGKGLASCTICFCHFPMWCPRSGVVLHCSYSWSLPPYLLSIPIQKSTCTCMWTGQRSAVGNVSCNRCESDCRSRGRELDHGPVQYFRWDWSWNNFYGHSPPFRWIIQEGLLSVTRISYKGKYVHEVLVNCSFKLAQEKVYTCS